MTGAAARRRRSLTEGRALRGADQRDGETVVALAADRLDRRGIDSGVGGDHFVELALGLDFGVVAVGVSESSVADLAK